MRSHLVEVLFYRRQGRSEQLLEHAGVGAEEVVAEQVLGRC